MTTLWERFTALAAEDPHARAVTCGGESVSRAELRDLASRMAVALDAQGAGESSYTSIVLPTGIDCVAAILAAWAVGSTPQVLSPNMAPRELADILELTAPVAVVAVADTALPGSLNPAALPPLGGALPPAGRTPTWWKAPTSGGSSGRPKVIVSTLPGTAETVAAMAGLFRITGNGTLLVTAPLSHNAPFVSAVGGVMCGQHVVLMPRFDAAEALRLVQSHGVGWVYAVPTMMSRIDKLPDRDSYDVSTVKVLLHMAAPCPPQLKESFIGWLGADAVCELYAGTEAQAGTFITGTEWLGHRGSVGRVAIGEIEIRDVDGAVLPPLEVGRVWLRTTNPEPTYRYIGATATHDENGWECLGDLGCLDADGYLYLSDREADMILVGGSNVYPAEIEAALLEHPQIDDACVIGLPDADRGSVPLALVRIVGGGELPDLGPWLRERLAAYKLPRGFEVVDEPLRDAAGKVRRSQLRAERIAVNGATA